MPRGGPRPNSGGRRPGAGRKKAETKVVQQAARDLFNAAFSDEDVTTIANVVRSFCLAGSLPHIQMFAAYRLGKPPEEVTISGDKDAPLRIEVVYVDDADSPL